MDFEAAFKKVFAKLDELGKRVTALDTNGKLDEIKKEMKKVAANSQVVVSTMHAHGGSIDRLEKAVTRLHVQCPMFEPKNRENGAGGVEDRVRPGSNEYEALEVAVKTAK